MLQVLKNSLPDEDIEITQYFKIQGHQTKPG